VPAAPRRRRRAPSSGPWAQKKTPTAVDAFALNENENVRAFPALIMPVPVDIRGFSSTSPASPGLSRFLNYPVPLHYHVAVDGGDICKSILPEEPTDRTKTEAAHYLEQIQTLTVQYQSVVEQIILRLDGRSFSEQAFHEMCERCHGAAWNISKQTPKFEVANGTIRFLNYFSNYECSVCEWWKLTEDMREILRGAAHFETENYHTFPPGVSELLDGKSITVDFIDWPGGEKIRSLKMFKNGRVDLKFSSGELAGEFVHKYLGTMC
jgi:hypothetical protein